MMVANFLKVKGEAGLTTRFRVLCCGLVLGNLLWISACTGHPAGFDRGELSFQQTGTFLAAADYRRAIEECQRHVTEQPSAQSYLWLTYVYQALDAYVESLAKADRWVEVELLATSLDSGRPEDLMNSPDILARIAKELIQASARRQSDVAAAMAARLDAGQVAELWRQQQDWRNKHAKNWWLGMPEEWRQPIRHLTP